MNLATRKHPVKALECLAGLGKKNYTGSGTIQPMGDAEENVAGLSVTLFDKALQRIGQWFVARLVGLHNLMAGLADGDDVVVFVDNLYLPTDTDQS